MISGGRDPPPGGWEHIGSGSWGDWSLGLRIQLLETKYFTSELYVILQPLFLNSVLSLVGNTMDEGGVFQEAPVQVPLLDTVVFHCVLCVASFVAADVLPYQDQASFKSTTWAVVH